MIVLHLYNPETEKWHNGDLSLLSLPLHGDQRLWVNLSGATHDEQQQLLAKFGIHPEISDDFLRERHPPKLESSNNFTLMILRAYAGKDFIDYPGHAQLSLLFSNRLFYRAYAIVSLTVKLLSLLLPHYCESSGQGAPLLQFSTWIKFCCTLFGKYT